MRLIPNQLGPYLLTTLGVHLFKYAYDDATTFEYGYGLRRYSVSGSYDNFDIEVGAGYELELNDRLYMDINANYDHIFFAQYNHMFFDSDSFSYVGISTGLRFWL